MNDTPRRYIHIRNWDHYQHRDTTRNQKSGAPWIKDYVGQLNDADWLELTCAQCGVLQGLRLMYAASRGRGISKDSAKRLLSRTTEELRRFDRNLEALNHAGFVVFSDSKSLSNLPAELRQVASLDVDVERDTDEDGERQQQKDNPGLTEARTPGFLDGLETKGQGSQTTEGEEHDADHQPERHLPPPQTHANGSQPTPSTADGPLANDLRTELARAQGLHL